MNLRLRVLSVKSPSIFAIWWSDLLSNDPFSNVMILPVGDGSVIISVACLSLPAGSITWTKNLEYPSSKLYSWASTNRIDSVPFAFENCKLKSSTVKTLLLIQSI